MTGITAGLAERLEGAVEGLTGGDKMGISYYVGTMDLRKVGVLAD